ncbi:MAG: flavin reductase family protein [Chloroflexota bacterium]|nr:flavin reductase family protein [Chloroflexota bacterium]
MEESNFDSGSLGRVYSVAPDDLHPRDAYQLLVSLIVPRPVAWISTVGADGSLNLAPFSFFNAVGGTPPTIMVSIGERAGQPKDTLRNIEETGEFVVHIADEELAERMNATSGEYPYNVNEFARAGLTPVASAIVKPPRILEAPVAMECRASQFVPVAGTRYRLVLGHIVLYHVIRGLLRSEGGVDANKLHAIARLGGNEYTSVRRVFTMSRPEV